MTGWVPLQINSKGISSTFQYNLIKLIGTWSNEENQIGKDCSC